jgi:membrane fusion protein, multidrug efflux system
MKIVCSLRSMPWRAAVTARTGWANGFALVLLALLTACAKPEPAPEPVRSVRTMVVAEGSAGGQREYAAEVKARVESRLGFRVGGKLVSRRAEMGQHVKAGDALAQLDAQDLRLGKEAAQAQWQAAQTQYELAALEFKRYQELRDQGFISVLELERRAAALKAAKAQTEQARAQADVQSNQAGYARLTATVAGIVTAIEAEPGTVLAAGAPVLRLAHDGPRDAVFSVPEDAALGLRALVGQTGALSVRPWGGAKPISATVREVAAAADPVTRTFAVKADLGPDQLQLGQTLTAVLELPRQSGVSKLPLTAVMQHEGRSAVWLVDRATMTVRAQAVGVASAEGNQMVIASGLKPGDVVVTAGVHVLAPGRKVKLLDSGPVGAAPGTAAATAAPASPAAPAPAPVPVPAKVPAKVPASAAR